MKTINFKIIYNKNDDIYQYGYVEIPDDVEELPDWFYYDQNGFAIPREFTNHDGIGIKQIGATNEQEAELDLFANALHDEVDFINDVILNADENENRTYVRNDITIIVNEGANMELVCKTDYDPNDLQFGDLNFYALLSFKYNGKTIEWEEEYLEELADAIDSTYAGEGRYHIINNSTIEIEINDEYDKELGEYVGLTGHNSSSRELIKEHIRDAKSIFARQLVRNLGVYGIASVIYQEKHGKLNESACDKFANNWEQGFESEDVAELCSLTSKDVERIIKEDMEEGYE